MTKQSLEIHFFTIVVNGNPFIKQHLTTFEKLPIKWHWHIIEGVASLKHDTAWSIANGGKIPDSFHNNGLSNDGTTEYLDEVKISHPNQISIYRKKGGEFWEGKLEMVNAPLKNIKKECLLWEIDVDEFWTTEQIVSAHEMFQDNPKKFAAFYWCHYFVGPELILLTRYGYANNPSMEWQRTWRYKPNFFWGSHEPPILVERSYSGKISPVLMRGAFSHEETEARGLVFQHFAYVNENQLLFKEDYYGYKDALSNWRRLQKNTAFPAKLKDYFTWVGDDTLVDKIQSVGIVPIIKLSSIS